jgi:flagellar hook-length control protein FliK
VPVQGAPTAVAIPQPAIPAGLPAEPLVPPTIPASASSPALAAAAPAANDIVAAPEIQAPAALPGVDKHTAGDNRPLPLRSRAGTPITDATSTTAEREAAPTSDGAPRDVDRDTHAANLQVGDKALADKTDNDAPRHIRGDAISATTNVAIDASHDPVPPTQAAPTAATAAATAPPAVVATVTAAPQPQPVAVPLAGLAVEIVAQVHAGKQRFEIRLDPPELGRIDVRLDVDRQGHVTSRLVVERAETLDLLKRDASELQRALQQAGLKTSDNALQFSLRQQAFTHHDTGTQHAARIVVPEDDPAPLEALRHGYGRLLGLGGGLDIRV